MVPSHPVQPTTKYMSSHGKERSTDMPTDAPTDNDLVPLDRRTILRQVECPVQAKNKYGAFEGLGFALGEVFPEMIGYLVAYNFTGMGSNNMGFFGKMGFDDELSRSKRLLGFNYFLPVNREGTAGSDLVKCTTSSGAKCSGKAPSYYIRTYGVARGGNFTFGIVEDVLDINPVSVLESAFSSGTGAVKCKPVTLPVGSNFDYCQESVDGFNYYDTPNTTKTHLGYQKAFHYDAVTNTDRDKHTTKVNDFVKTCDEACATFWDNDPDNRAFRKDNCMRDCRRIWWEEEHCIPVPDFESPPVKYTTCGANEGDKSYRIPIGSSHKHKESDKPANPKQTDFIAHKKGADKLNESFQNEYHNRRPIYIGIGRCVLLVLLVLFIVLLCYFR